MTLETGFYLLDSDLNLKTRTVNKGKPGETRRTVEEPIRFRTIASAKDGQVLAPECAILCVNGERFHFPD